MDRDDWYCNEIRYNYTVTPIYVVQQNGNMEMAKNIYTEVMGIIDFKTIFQPAKRTRFCRAGYNKN